VAPPGNQAANREYKLQPIATGGPGLLDLFLSFGRAGNINNSGRMQKAVVPKNWTMSQALPHPAAHLVVNDLRHDAQDKGKSFFVLISVPPENKNSRAMIHMLTVEAPGACLVVQPPENKKDRIPGIGLEFCGCVFPPVPDPGTISVYPTI